jgi:DNA-binding response OmpR family regulator
MKRIVLVEDDEPIRDIFHIVFKESGYDLINLDSGEKIINNEIDAPDLFILDKQISGANGLEVCRFIKSSEKFKNVPVVMLSANPDIKTLAKDAGADEAIAKPFSLKKLRETIAKFTV